MIDNNLPPGCKLSDIPGWSDIEEDVNFECECGNEWVEPDMTVDPTSGGHEVEATCPECNTLVKRNWEPYDPRDDYDPQDDYDRYEAQDHPNW